MAEKLDLGDYYTAAEAAEVLTKNSKKRIDPAYMRTLARYGVVTPKKVGRLNVYPKHEVDRYVVEDRGAKLEHQRQARAKKLKRGQRQAKEAA
jgi:hypothetical protein